MEGKEKKRSRARGGRAEEYLDALCRQIHWKSYRKAIRDELKDHIEDASSEMRKKGLSADQALEKALCDLGDPAETGRKLNRIYRPSWNKRLAAAVLGGTALFQVLYLSAGVQSGVLDGAGLRMRLLETVIWLLAGVLLSAVVFSRDYSRTAVVRKWLLILCLATVLGAAAVRQVFRGQGESMVTGLMLLLPVFSCFAVGRQKGEKQPGALLAAGAAFVPVLAACWLEAYSAAVLLAGTGVVLLAYALHRDWFELGKKKGYWLLAVLPAAAGGVWIAAQYGWQRFAMGMDGFFIQDYVGQFRLLGPSGVAGLAEQTADFPLTLCASRYGWIVLLLYGLLLLLLCRGAVKVFRSQKSFTGRLLTAALLTGWILRAGLAVLTNLGLPLAPGAVLPFLDGHCAMAVFYFQMGILETVSCFGNYVKGERGDGDKSRLLDIRDGKIIITYR